MTKGFLWFAMSRDLDESRRISGRARRELLRLRRSAVAAPDDVQVGAQQNQVDAVEVADRLIGNIQDLERRAVGLHRLFQAGILPGAAEAKQRVAAADAVLQGDVALEPDMRQARAGPGCRQVFAEQGLGPARLLADDRRALVAVAE